MKRSALQMVYDETSQQKEKKNRVPCNTTIRCFYHNERHPKVTRLECEFPHCGNRDLIGPACCFYLRVCKKCGAKVCPSCADRNASRYKDEEKEVNNYYGIPYKETIYNKICDCRGEPTVNEDWMPNPLAIDMMNVD